MTGGRAFPMNPNRVWIVGVLETAVLLATFLVGFARPVEALPSFARQTGQACGTCHTDFPFLTPFGRRFKLLGYTVGGGMFKTTPFPAFPNAHDAPAQADKLRRYLKAVDSGATEDKDYVPPISMMMIAGYTHHPGAACSTDRSV